MKFKNFILENILYVISAITSSILIYYLASISMNNMHFAYLIILILLLFWLIPFISSYIRWTGEIRYLKSLREGFIDGNLSIRSRKQSNSPTFKEMEDIIGDIAKYSTSEIEKRDISLDAYKDFLDIWIHEIKTRIATLELLTNNLPSKEKEMMLFEMKALEDDVDRVLFHSKLDEVNSDFSMERFNLNFLVKRVLKNNSMILISSDFSIEMENIDIEVIGDIRYLEFILRQIILNSVKYRKKSPILKFTGVKFNDRVELKIRDNGVGISSKDIKKVFNKGFTGTNGSQLRKSTGFGLYISKKMCDNLNIGIAIDSSDNEIDSYTTVTLTFPLLERF